MRSPSSSRWRWSICLGLLLQAGQAGRDRRCDARGTHRVSHPMLQGRELVEGRILGAWVFSQLQALWGY